jgi:hypothetical protein
LDIDPRDLDECGKRLVHLYLRKFEHGFPFLTSVEPEIIIGQPCIHISGYLDQMFDSDWDCVEDETRRKVYLTKLIDTRLTEEFWKWGLVLPDWC